MLLALRTLQVTRLELLDVSENRPNEQLLQVMLAAGGIANDSIRALA